MTLYVHRAVIPMAMQLAVLACSHEAAPRATPRSAQVLTETPQDSPVILVSRDARRPLRTLLQCKPPDRKATVSFRSHSLVDSATTSPLTLYTNEGELTLPDLLVRTDPVWVRDTLVLGFYYDADSVVGTYRYDRFTCALSREPFSTTPQDFPLRTAVPVFAPDTGHVAYIGSGGGSAKYVVVRTWPTWGLAGTSATVHSACADARQDRVRWHQWKIEALIALCGRTSHAVQMRGSALPRLTLEVDTILTPEFDAAPASLSWWPASDTIALPLPDRTRPGVLAVTTVGSHPCSGFILTRITDGERVLYSDSISIAAAECDEYYVDDLHSTYRALVEMRPEHDWSSFASVVKEDARGQYGSVPYILVYKNGYESVRALAWNPATGQFDVLVPGGLW